MDVQRIRSLPEAAAHSHRWNELAQGVPFRSWPWLESWWRAYGHCPRRATDLYTLLVWEKTLLGNGATSDNLVGIAPLARRRSPSRGRVLTLLGLGEVCSDYVGLLSEPMLEQRTAQAVADWLIEASTDPEHRWDLLELSGVDAVDTAVALLLEALAQRGATVIRRQAERCWRIELPATWDEYVASLSKSHRKQVRRLERAALESGRAVLRQVETNDELSQGMAILVDLHQRRRQSLGQPGCFQSPRFSAFQREVIPRLLKSGMLRLSWLELEGRPVAAEYHLAGGRTVYAYQSGLEPGALEEEPGRLAAIATLRKAIDDRMQAFDFLRGDEPYKAHWRAEPRPMLHVDVLPARRSARLRHRVLTAGDSAKGWIKAGLQAAGLRPPPAFPPGKPAHDAAPEAAAVV